MSYSIFLINGIISMKSKKDNNMKSKIISIWIIYHCLILFYLYIAIFKTKYKMEKVHWQYCIIILWNIEVTIVMINQPLLAEHVLMRVSIKYIWKSIHFLFIFITHTTNVLCSYITKLGTYVIHYCCFYWNKFILNCFFSYYFKLL